MLVAGPVALRHANVHLAGTPKETLRARSRTRSKRFDVAIVAKAPIAQFAAWGKERGWRFAPLYSSSRTAFNRDYNAESDKAGQLPVAHVFTRTDGRIHHRWSSELFAVPPDPGQHPRHVDYTWPIWKVLDLTPEGRGTDWHPRYGYDW